VLKPTPFSSKASMMLVRAGAHDWTKRAIEVSARQPFGRRLRGVEVSAPATPKISGAFTSKSLNPQVAGMPKTAPRQTERRAPLKTLISSLAQTQTPAIPPECWK
jgi:hypothetical protein